MTSNPGRAVLIAGPTASGKSALALRLAEKIGAAIVNADSMQVYRDLAIITARPLPEEEARVPHRLYGHVDAAVNYSTGQWLRDVGEVLAGLSRAGRPAILVGGTGLYFKALTAGLAAVPPIPAALRQQVRARLTAEGAPALHAELMRLDPATARRITVNDRSRISRALEVVQATGRPLSDWHREGLPPLIDAGRAAKVFVTCERGELMRRIETRFATMLKAGALEEVRALAARRLDPSLPAMKAHGVPWLIRHLKGEIGLEEAVAGAVMDTRRYAKRQLTWFRNQMPDWPWHSAEEADKALENQLSGR
ncbi:MAG TPA: tRNA (adenosine(37)-N6)-dimethylallyltransferase MiaA [Pseudolabrys sp.]|nr:tRNA (adenosine(37)-N6)-dimethylallyltransferase MiaA [Pseudolabrys sp.]